MKPEGGGPQQWLRLVGPAFPGGSDAWLGEMNFAVLYMDHSEWAPYVFELHGIWHTAYQAVKFPELDGGAKYMFAWAPNAAINYLPNSSGGTDRHLYLFYGCDFSASYGNWEYAHWELYDMGTRP